MVGWAGVEPPPPAEVLQAAGHERGAVGAPLLRAGARAARGRRPLAGTALAPLPGGHRPRAAQVALGPARVATGAEGMSTILY